MADSKSSRSAKDDQDKKQDTQSQRGKAQSKSGSSSGTQAKSGGSKSQSKSGGSQGQTQAKSSGSKSQAKSGGSQGQSQAKSGGSQGQSQARSGGSSSQSQSKSDSSQGSQSRNGAQARGEFDVSAQAGGREFSAQGSAEFGGRQGGQQSQSQGGQQSQSQGGQQGRSQGGQQGRTGGNSKQGGGNEARGGFDQDFNAEAAIGVLNNLLIADYDALGLYERVIQNLDNDQIRSTVEQFRGDHERHIQELTQAIRQLGGEPANRPSMMGPIAKVLASVASTLMGNKGALQALMQGEVYTLSTYEAASIAGFPQELIDLVVRNREDEQRHNRWVGQAIENM